LEDQELVAKILEGDEAAKEVFYRQYHRRLFVTAAHFLGANDAELEDTVHDTYLKALAALPQFRQQASLATWLNHICVNLCFDRIRRRKRQLLSQQQDLELFATSLAHDQHQQSLGEAQQKQRHLALRKAAESMQEPCRSILIQRDFENRAYAEIAEALKMPIGTVMSRLSRCREHFRQRLEILLKAES
jgi:RNA polymerase sigma factor (sigma-70 family)